MKIDEAIKNNLEGLCYGNRLILPFHFHLLKVIVDNDIITDFSPAARGIFIEENETFTDIYFHDYKSLKEKITKFESIKILAVEKGENIFDPANFRKLSLYLLEKNKIKIEYSDEDILFIE
jgi:hypothetical protein